MPRDGQEISRWETDGGRSGAEPPIAVAIAKGAARPSRAKSPAKARPLAALVSPQSLRGRRPAIVQPELAVRKFEIGQVVSIPGGTFDRSPTAVFTVTRWMPEDASGFGYRVRGGDNVERAVSERQMEKVP